MHVANIQKTESIRCPGAVGGTMKDGLGGSGSDPSPPFPKPYYVLRFFLGGEWGVRVRTVEPRSTVWERSDKKM